MSNSVSEDTVRPEPGSSKMPELGDQAQSPAALHQITEKNATSSPLLRLPAEIRTMVFNHVYQDERYLIGTWYSLKERPSLRRDLGLFLVSRHLYHETALLPYKLGVFMVADDEWHDRSVLISLNRFLRERSKAQIEVMARVECYDSCYLTLTVMGTGVYWAARIQLK